MEVKGFKRVRTQTAIFSGPSVPKRKGGRGSDSRDLGNKGKGNVSTHFVSNSSGEIKMHSTLATKNNK